MENDTEIRFGVRTLFWLIAMVAVWFAIQTAIPAWARLAVEIGLLYAAISPTVAAICYATGKFRAFAIGALMLPLALAVHTTLSLEGLLASLVRSIGEEQLVGIRYQTTLLAWMSRASMFWVPFSCLSGLLAVSIRQVFSKSEQ